MFEFLKGIIVEKSDKAIILDVKDIGYKIFVPLSFNSPIKEKILIYISMIIKDEKIFLYGFEKKDEKKLFDELINISGIGPKIALLILSYLGYERFNLSIYNKDYKSFNSIPGIGKKMAEKIILEMKDKIGKIVKNQSKDYNFTQNIEDAIKALINLGFSQWNAREVIESIIEKNKNLDTATLISIALKKK